MLAQNARRWLGAAALFAACWTLQPAAANEPGFEHLPAGLAAALREARGEAARSVAASAHADARAAAWGELAMLYHAHRLHHLAEEAYRQAIAEAARARWRYLLGIVLSQRGEIEAALAEFRAAARSLPKSMAIWYRVGVAAGLLGDLAGAETAFDRAAALQPDSALLFAARADLAIARGEPQAAVELLERAWALEPEAGQLAHKLATAHRALGNREAAHDWLAKQPDNSLAPKIDDPLLLEVARMSRSGRFFETAADWALARGDHAAAAEALAQAARLRPDDDQLAARLATLRAQAGAFAMQGGRFEEAEQQYRQLAAERPDDAYGHYWLGMSLLRQADCAALPVLRHAVQLRANWGEAHIARARAEALCGSGDVAREGAAALLKLEDNADTRLTLALAELALGRRDEARRLATPVANADAAQIIAAARAVERQLPQLAFATSSTWWLPPEVRDRGEPGG